MRKKVASWCREARCGEYYGSYGYGGLITVLTLLDVSPCKLSHNLCSCDPPMALGKLLESLLMTSVDGQHIRQSVACNSYFDKVHTHTYTHTNTHTLRVA